MLITDSVMVEQIGDALWDYYGRPEGQRWECHDKASDLLDVLALMNHVIVDRDRFDW